MVKKLELYKPGFIANYLKYYKLREYVHRRKLMLLTFRNMFIQINKIKVDVIFAAKKRKLQF